MCMKKLILSIFSCFIVGVYAEDYYINGDTGNDVSNNGSLSAPWKTLGGAFSNLTTLAPETTVTLYVSGGVYREKITLTSDFDNVITVRPLLFDEPPVFKGSEVVSNWVNHSGSIYRTSVAGLFDMGRTSGGDTRDHIDRAQQVFVDGWPLQLIGYPTDEFGDYSQYYRPVGAGIEDMYPGTFITTNGYLYVWLADSGDPNNSEIEVSVRNYILDASAAGNIVFDGLCFMYCNSFEETYVTNKYRTAFGDGMVRLGYNNITLKNCYVGWGDSIGIKMQAGGISSTGAVSAVINCTVENNGWLGILLQNYGYHDRIVSNSWISGNNYRDFTGGWGASGIKVAGHNGSGNVLIKNNHVIRNNSVGVWTDSCCRRGGIGAVYIDGNLIHNNMDYGVFVEISTNIFVFNNLLSQNAFAQIYVSNSDCTKIYNNTMICRHESGVCIAAYFRTDEDNIPYSCIGNEICNNIIYNASVGLSIPVDCLNPYVSENNTSDYNCFYSDNSDNRVNEFFRLQDGGVPTRNLSEWKNATANDFHSIWHLPGFQDRLYRLSSDSDCVDCGDNTIAYTPLDKAGVVRIIGAGIDLGCYEQYADPLVGDSHFASTNGNNIPPFETAENAAQFIEDALNYASDGDQVIISGGVYAEAIDLTVYSEVKVSLAEGEIVELAK